MTFLNPAFLWGLLAIAIPIIIHLFNFRRPKRVLFSNISFVKEINQAVVQRVKLKQWLLLAARILAIAALAMAFANPVIVEEGSTTASMQANKSVVILVDNSKSMSAADGSGVWLQQAKLLGREIIKSYAQADEFQIQTTGQLQLNRRFVQQSEALEHIDQVDFQDKKLPFTEVLKDLELLFTEARNQERVLYFLSDFQESTVMSDTAQQLDWPDNYKVNFLPIGDRKPPNIYISDLSFQNKIIQQGKPVTMQLALNNDAEEAVEDLSIRAEVEDREVSIGSVDRLRGGQQTLTEITFSPQRAGWQSGKVRIDDAEVSFDNTRYFSYYIPKDHKILVVNGKGDLQYLKLLFQNLLKQYKVKTIDEKQLANADLGQYTTLVMAGVMDVSSGMQAKINSWVRNGGGVLFFPQKEMDKNSINEFYKTLGIGQFGELKTAQSGKEVQRPPLDHVLFEGVFEQAQQEAEFDSPLITQHFDFTPRSGQIQQALLQDSEGHPILHEARLKRGRVYTFTLYPDLDWSDFPLKSSFVPILYRATLIINNTAQQEFSQTIGEYELKRLQTASRERVRLVQPEQDVELFPEQYVRGGALLLKFDFMDLEPGNYDVIQQDSLLGKISFNLPDEESRLSITTADELSDELEQQGLQRIQVSKAEPDVVRAGIQTAQRGVPLWKYFLLLTVLMLVAEVLILKLIP